MVGLLNESSVVEKVFARDCYVFRSGTFRKIKPDFYALININEKVFFFLGN